MRRRIRTRYQSHPTRLSPLHPFPSTLTKIQDLRKYQFKRKEKDRVLESYSHSQKLFAFQKTGRLCDVHSADSV